VSALGWPQPPPTGQGGRPRKVDDATATKARNLRDKGIVATDIAKMLGVSRATVYRYLSESVTARSRSTVPFG
jgi:hypothetical protein